MKETVIHKAYWWSHIDLTLILSMYPGMSLKDTIMLLSKLGLSCAKLRPNWASYQLALVWLAYTEAA